MKKAILLFGMLGLGFALLPQAGKAQVRVQINIGAQPLWGPAGYDYTAYYYMPDIDVFFNVNARRYVYFSQGRWIQSPYLPGWCRGYDLYHGYKVVINDPDPWERYGYYRDRYARYRNYGGYQPILRDRRYEGYDREERRYEDRDERPGYGRGHEWHERHEWHDRGRGRGRGHGRGWGDRD